jgi:hypothetical protein
MPKPGLHPMLQWFHMIKLDGSFVRVRTAKHYQVEPKVVLLKDKEKEQATMGQIGRFKERFGLKLEK